MGIEGQLNIALCTDSEGVEQVSIDSSRPVHASRVFIGRPVAKALPMVPALFTICATAQACAGVRACEQALGVPPGAPLERLRDALVRLESVREHLWRILLDWPGFIGETQQHEGMAEMLALQRDIHQAFAGGQEPFRQPFQLMDADSAPASKPGVPDELAQRLDSILERAVFGMTPARWLEIDTPDTLRKWALSGATAAAHLLASVIQSEWSGIGACQVAALPSLEMQRETQQLQRMMQEKSFIERPQWSGDCCETTCLTRVESPLMQQLRDRHGNGLLTRLAARLTELAQLSLKLFPAAAPAVSYATQNPGIGRASAARGRLFHRVLLEGERVAGYQILAPTEWNFHPQGVVARSLATLKGDKGEMERQARLLINAIDPCVSYQLSIG